MSRYHSINRNQGLGSFDSPERAYTSENPEWYVQAGHTGPIGRRMMLYNRFYYDQYSSSAISAVEAPTYIVPDDLNRGGAQRRGRTERPPPKGCLATSATTSRGRGSASAASSMCGEQKCRRG